MLLTWLLNKIFYPHEVEFYTDEITVKISNFGTIHFSNYTTNNGIFSTEKLTISLNVSEIAETRHFKNKEKEKTSKTSSFNKYFTRIKNIISFSQKVSISSVEFKEINVKLNFKNFTLIEEYFPRREFLFKDEDCFEEFLSFKNLNITIDKDYISNIEFDTFSFYNDVLYIDKFGLKEYFINQINFKFSFVEITRNILPKLSQWLLVKPKPSSITENRINEDLVKFSNIHYLESYWKDYCGPIYQSFLNLFNFTGNANWTIVDCQFEIINDFEGGKDHSFYMVFNNPINLTFSNRGVLVSSEKLSINQNQENIGYFDQFKISWDILYSPYINVECYKLYALHKKKGIMFFFYLLHGILDTYRQVRKPWRTLQKNSIIKNKILSNLNCQDKCAHILHREDSYFYEKTLYVNLPIDENGIIESDSYPPSRPLPFVLKFKVIDSVEFDTILSRNLVKTKMYNFELSYDFSRYFCHLNTKSIDLLYNNKTNIGKIDKLIVEFSPILSTKSEYIYPVYFFLDSVKLNLHLHDYALLKFISHFNKYSSEFAEIINSHRNRYVSVIPVVKSNIFHIKNISFVFSRDVIVNSSIFNYTSGQSIREDNEYIFRKFRIFYKNSPVFYGNCLKLSNNIFYSGTVPHISFFKNIKVTRDYSRQNADQLYKTVELSILGNSTLMMNKYFISSFFTIKNLFEINSEISASVNPRKYAIIIITNAFVSENLNIIYQSKIEGKFKDSLCLKIEKLNFSRHRCLGPRIFSNIRRNVETFMNCENVPFSTTIWNGSCVGLDLTYMRNSNVLVSITIINNILFCHRQRVNLSNRSRFNLSSNSSVTNSNRIIDHSFSLVDIELMSMVNCNINCSLMDIISEVKTMKQELIDFYEVAKSISNKQNKLKEIVISSLTERIKKNSKNDQFPYANIKNLQHQTLNILQPILIYWKNEDNTRIIQIKIDPILKFIKSNSICHYSENQTNKLPSTKLPVVLSNIFHMKDDSMCQNIQSNYSTFLSNNICANIHNITSISDVLKYTENLPNESINEVNSTISLNTNRDEHHSSYLTNIFPFRKSTTKKTESILPSPMSLNIKRGMDDEDGQIIHRSKRLNSQFKLSSVKQSFVLGLSSRQSSIGRHSSRLERLGSFMPWGSKPSSSSIVGQSQLHLKMMIFSWTGGISMSILDNRDDKTEVLSLKFKDLHSYLINGDFDTHKSIIHKMSICPEESFVKIDPAEHINIFMSFLGRCHGKRDYEEEDYDDDEETIVVNDDLITEYHADFIWSGSVPISIRIGHFNMSLSTISINSFKERSFSICLSNLILGVWINRFAPFLVLNTVKFYIEAGKESSDLLLEICGARIYWNCVLYKVLVFMLDACERFSSFMAQYKSYLQCQSSKMSSRRRSMSHKSGMMSGFTPRRSNHTNSHHILLTHLNNIYSTIINNHEKLNILLSLENSGIILTTPNSVETCLPSRHSLSPSNNTFFKKSEMNHHVSLDAADHIYYPLFIEPNDDGLIFTEEELKSVTCLEAIDMTIDEDDLIYEEDTPSATEVWLKCQKIVLDLYIYFEPSEDHAEANSPRSFKTKVSSADHLSISLSVRLGEVSGSAFPNVVLPIHMRRQMDRDECLFIPNINISSNSKLFPYKGANIRIYCPKIIASLNRDEFGAIQKMLSDCLLLKIIKGRRKKQKEDDIKHVYAKSSPIIPLPHNTSGDVIISTPSSRFKKRQGSIVQSMIEYTHGKITHNTDGLGEEAIVALSAYNSNICTPKSMDFREKEENNFVSLKGILPSNVINCQNETITPIFTMDYAIDQIAISLREDEDGQSDSVFVKMNASSLIGKHVIRKNTTVNNQMSIELGDLTVVSIDTSSLRRNEKVILKKTTELRKGIASGGYKLIFSIKSSDRHVSSSEFLDLDNMDIPTNLQHLGEENNIHVIDSVLISLSPMKIDIERKTADSVYNFLLGDRKKVSHHTRKKEGNVNSSIFRFIRFSDIQLLVSYRSKTKRISLKNILVYHSAIVKKYLVGSWKSAVIDVFLSKIKQSLLKGFVYHPFRGGSKMLFCINCFGSSPVGVGSHRFLDNEDNVLVEDLKGNSSPIIEEDDDDETESLFITSENEHMYDKHGNYARREKLLFG